jgi:hypothetical protein
VLCLGRPQVTYSSCPPDIVNAPVSVVWSLLTNPAAWGRFFDLRIIGINPEGPAAVGQIVYAESGPSILHLKLEFQFLKIDPAEHVLELVRSTTISIDGLRISQLACRSALTNRLGLSLHDAHRRSFPLGVLVTAWFPEQTGPARAATR